MCLCKCIPVSSYMRKYVYMCVYICIYVCVGMYVLTMKFSVCCTKDLLLKEHQFKVASGEEEQAVFDNDSDVAVVSKLVSQ